MSRLKRGEGRSGVKVKEGEKVGVVSMSRLKRGEGQSGKCQG